MERRDKFLDVALYIDEMRVSRRQILIYLVCAFVAMADGFDAQAIGYVGPAIVQGWGITRAALGPVFVAGLTGMALGGMLCGVMADRVGRRPVVILSCLLFSALTFAASFSDSVQTLIVLRFLAGLGIGGAMPNVVALTAEYAPKRVRATILMLMYSGFSLGAALGGFLSAWLIGAYGWKSVLLFGGILPAVVTVTVLLWLPESIRFMAAKGNRTVQIKALLEKFTPGSKLPVGTTFGSTELQVSHSPVAQLFESKRAVQTLLLWAIYFLCFLVLYLLSNWLPVMIHDAGASVGQAVFITALYQVGGTLGSIVLGRVMDKSRPASVMAMVMGAGGIVVCLIGAFGIESQILLSALAGAAGVTVIGGVICSHYVAADTYPTALRSTGLGWAFGAGRFGGIVGSLYGGALFSMHIGISNMLFASVVPLFVAAIAGVCLARTGNLQAAMRRHDEGALDQPDATISPPDHLRIKP